APISTGVTTAFPSATRNTTGIVVFESSTATADADAPPPPPPPPRAPSGVVAAGRPNPAPPRTPTTPPRDRVRMPPPADSPHRARLPLGHLRDRVLVHPRVHHRLRQVRHLHDHRPRVVHRPGHHQLPHLRRQPRHPPVDRRRDRRVRQVLPRLVDLRRRHVD